ncbi:glycerol-3-phosphate acyltransferase, partial [Staphylococcus capitis]|uniref:glycerol-3-phosphate acyltransferase n=1 Tax=Staphylococcus capitis TaxID=29388 RepID=UPI001642927C
GGFGSGLVIGKLFLKKDIREYGSGNRGGRNRFGVLGRVGGLVVTFLDMFKGFIRVFLPVWFRVHADGIISRL